MTELIERQDEARRALMASLLDDILGPAGGPDEVLSGGERPLTRYLVGRLAPTGSQVAPEEDDASGEAGADDDDSDVGMAAPVTMAMNPSSIGLSFVVEVGTTELDVTATWGRYGQEVQGDGTEVNADGGGVGDGDTSGPGPSGDGGAGSGDSPPPNGEPGGAGAQRDDKRRRRRTVWRRYPAELRCPVDLSAGGGRAGEAEGASVDTVIRRRPDGRVAVSVFLVNRVHTTRPDRPEDDEWLFQPAVSVRAAGGGAVFVARRADEVDLADDRELRSNELLYLNGPEFATGHGCAAVWDPPEGPTAPTTRVATDLVPAYELPRVDPRESDDPGLDMRNLGGSGAAGVPGPRLRELLSPLADAYATWLDDLQRTFVPSLPADLHETALDHLETCGIALGRIRAGIDAVATDYDTRLAFCFANRAMALQRERTLKALAFRRGEPDPVVVARWRPFQLAFILLNLPPLADRENEDRDVADLLWFPTGGGKTEAYLGLTAFALAHRRLRPVLPGYETGAGVAVLMRYTLRLLTIQQFQRAATLICACEHLRRDEGEWGPHEFSVGLWVGRSGTPNWFVDAKAALDDLANDRRPPQGSPIQLLWCPWCGHNLPLDAWQADRRQERITVVCPDDECDFGPVATRDGLPVHTVDEQIYRHVPSLVIATVDKFAQMPFNGRIKALFGRVSSRCARHGWLTNGEKHARRHNAEPGWPKTDVVDCAPFEPPDLIVQDELHLISGPLGTLVGLYESAVDALASARWNGVVTPPKVVASTATIRRAPEQVRALFDRRLTVFPPPALDAASSWFGDETPTTQAPGRLYVGVFAPGKSVKTALLRVQAALLSRAKSLHEADAETLDTYMTLIGYFNSLRELGGAVRLAEDDIPSRIRLLHRRDPDTWASRFLNERRELTSNVRAEQIPEILGMLERRFPAGGPLPGSYPVDVLMASNMISVGVDIDRLGLMVVNGQPKTTAEYIQATSRVGRQSPGLVVTVYNWTRPRDISHYERFRSYHSALYRYVEATSVTPFSSRARDKGLAGVMTALVRLGDDSMTPGKAAGALDRASPWLDVVIGRLADRAEEVTGEADAGQDTRGQTVQQLDSWSNALPEDRPFVYSTRDLAGAEGDKRDYLLGAQEAGEHHGVLTAPGSLREVESELHVYLLDASGGEAEAS